MRTARLRFHTQTGGVTLQAQQPLTNVVRVTVQALAAVLGGTQSLHTNGYDEALALPTEQSATLALRTQQVIGYESGVARVIDPLAGSYYVESLTDAIEAGARALIAEVDALGGAARAIELGFFQEAIARSAYEIQKAQESGEAVVVGVNRFADGSPPPVIETPDFSALEARQQARLAEVRRRRDAGAVQRHPGRASRRGRRRVSPHAADSRRRPRPRDARRDQRYAAGSLGSVPAGVGRCSPAELRYEQLRLGRTSFHDVSPRRHEGHEGHEGTSDGGLANCHRRCDRRPSGARTRASGVSVRGGAGLGATDAQVRIDRQVPCR